MLYTIIILTMSIETYDTLYGETKQGKIQFWKIWMEPINQIQYKVLTEYGEVGTNHPQQTKPTLFLKGKNIGKSNETTAKEQAQKFMKKKWTDKIEKQGYINSNPNRSNPMESTETGTHSNSTNSNTTVFYPMLANKISRTNLSKLSFPAYAQPKLDGVRCVAFLRDNKVQLYSRTGKRFTGFHQIECELFNIATIFPDLVFDGELGCFPTTDAETGDVISPPELSFQETCGYVKRRTKHQDDRELDLIHFHIFDVVEEQNEDWEGRYETILQLKKEFKKTDTIHIVETVRMNSLNQFLDYHQFNVAREYEGTIYRSLRGMYIQKYRSRDLLKYKDVHTDEYPIVGYQSGKGNDTGTVIWVVQVGEKTCKVRPKGTRESRKKMLDRGDMYIGKLLTVQYQELTDDGLPRFPVGIVVRDYE